MDETRLKVTQFRIAAKQAMPYLGTTIYGMPDHPAKCSTMAVDKYGRLYWDASFVNTISVATGRFAILHETLHISLGHCRQAEKHLGPRPTKRQAELWNIACDAVVNGILCTLLDDAPEGIVTCGEYDLPPKGTAVQYYHILLDRDRQQEQERQFDNDLSQCDEGEDGDEEEDDDEDRDDDHSDAVHDDEGEHEGDRRADGTDDESGDDEGADGSGEEGGEGADADGGDDGDGDEPAPSGGDGDGEADDAEADREGDPSEGEGGDADDQRGSEGAGGSSADGIPRDYELPPDPGHEDREYSQTSDLEDAIREHEAANPGSVPGELKSAVDLRMRPQANPWDLLKGAVARAAASTIGAPDYTLRRFSRRQQDGGPRLRGVQRLTPKVVVILDTSGSMGGPRSERFVKALDVIAKGVARLKNVTVVCADTHPQRAKVVTSMRQFEIVGGGGTDMAGAIDAIDQRERPDSILLVSDCECHWYDRRPRASVVIADVGGAWHDRIPSWFKKIDLTKGGE
jgi:predicted metal-dependent peptidase